MYNCAVLKIILGLKKAVCATFKEADVRWESKLVAFGTDGTSVNLGKKSGLATLLKQEVPYLVDFHCLPHRLELALLDLHNSCRSVDDVYNVLQLIWKTYKYSPKSVRALKSIADELEINILKPTQEAPAGFHMSAEPLTCLLEDPRAPPRLNLASILLC